MDVSVLMVEPPGLRQVESDGIEERSPHFALTFRNSFSNVLVTYHGITQEGGRDQLRRLDLPRESLVQLTFRFWTPRCLFVGAEVEFELFWTLTYEAAT
jgi:hypothetical protein